MMQAPSMIEALRAARGALRAQVAPVWQDSCACTARLTDSIQHLCEAHGATVEREVLHVLPRETRQGRIDLVAAFPDGTRLAIELDRTRKRRSLRKLRDFQTDEQAYGLWVLWDARSRVSQQEGVAVMTLPDSTAERFAATRRHQGR
jgi:hypothetical protein